MTNWSQVGAGESYYLARSLVALGNEVNARWPNRDTSSDGAVGDPSHQARKSDHNPDWDSNGVIRAIDIDVNGIDVQQLLADTIGDPRLAYIIYNRRIASATLDGTPWNWEPYDGENPHTGHVHFSIKHTRSAEISTGPWLDTETEDDPFMGLDAADITAAVTAGVKAAIPSLAAADLQGELTAVRADNAFDSQAESYHAVGNALAAFRIQQAAAVGGLDLATLEGIRKEVAAFQRPLWAKP